jgi:hypothetical protein
MKKLGSISIMFILVLVVGFPASSQLKSSATQTVMFAVNRTKPILNGLTNILRLNPSSNSSETLAFQGALKKSTIKVTLSETSTLTTASKNTQGRHMDVRSILQARKSVEVDRIPRVITVTD